MKSFVTSLVVSCLVISGGATVARACFWAGTERSPSSIGKMADVPRTEAERKHLAAHVDAVAQASNAHVAALSAVGPRSAPPYRPDTKNH